MNDLISRHDVMIEFANFVRKFNSGELAQVPSWNDAVSLVGSMHAADLTSYTLYGYKLEHLAYVARVMEKEGVTAEYAARTFDDLSRMLKIILDEARERIFSIMEQEEKTHE